jgi:DnaJ-related protein SCJ1
MTLFLVAACLVMAAGKDYYKILDVPRDASKSQIKKHYKKLSRVYHPDKNRDNKQAEAKFMEISDGKVKWKGNVKGLVY